MRSSLLPAEYPTPQATGVPIRPPSTAILGISSADRHVSVSTVSYPQWSASTAYLIGSRVTYGGIPYQAIAASTNQAPPNVLYWEVVLPTTPYPAWDIATTYEIGDLVSYNDVSYISLVAVNVGNDPLLTLGTSWDETDGPYQFRTRTGRGSPFAFSISTQQPLLSGYFTRIAVTELEFTYALPPISPRNSKIGIKYNTGVGTPVSTRYLTIPSGFYTPAQLAAALQAQVIANTSLSAFTATINVPSSLNENAGVLLCQSNTTSQFAFVPVNPLDPASGMTAAPFSVLRTQYLQGRKQLYDQLNFAPNVGTIAGEYTLSTIVTTGPVSLLSTSFVDFVVPRLTANANTRDGDTSKAPRDLLCRVYLEAIADALNPENLGSQPFRVYREWSFPKQIGWDPEAQIGGLDFQLVDDQGFPLGTYDSSAVVGYLNDSQQPDWNLTLLATEQ